MNASYSSTYDDSAPLPHPYLREPKLYISGLAPNTRKEDLAELFRFCVPYRPNLPLDEQGRTLPGFIEFKELAAAEKALATLQNRPLPPPAPPCTIVLSPLPPSTPPTSLQPPAALPRLVKQLPIGITDSQLYDLFRPFGPLANVRSEAGFGPDIGVVEFWREEDARTAEEAMHCAEVGDQTISIQTYQPRRAPGALSDFSVSAPPFVPAAANNMYQPPQSQQNVSQNFPHPHQLFGFRPPVTPQPFSNILSLSSPPMSYPSLPPQQSPQQQYASLAPFQSSDPYGGMQPPQPPPPPQQQNMAMGQPPAYHTNSTPPPHHQPTPPMTPPRTGSMGGLGFNPMYPSPLSSPGTPHRTPSHGSPSSYPPFSLPYNTPPHQSLFYSPPGGNSPYSRSPPPGNGVFVHGPGQQVQFAPSFGPGSGSHSGLIDPCNLFVKNLDSSIDSNELFTHFRPFGSIVSARVMRNESGQSRGFGFVSYQTPEQASSALSAMNGVSLGSKPIIVRLHEPKQLRQEKLASRYGGRSPHPRSASGATSPSPSDGGEVTSPLSLDRVRRGSGSYYQAALAGTLNMPLKYEELSSLSPVVRKEVLSGELTRRLKALDAVPPTDVDSIAESLVNMSLAEVIEIIQNPDNLAEQVRKLQYTPAEAEPAPVVAEPAPVVSLAPPEAAAPTSVSSTPAPPSSAPEHPSTPVSVAASLSDPPRTSSPSGSLTVASEKEKLLASVTRISPANATEITSLLLSLSKKERAMCLFNPEYLKNKVAEAKAVLEAEDDSGEMASISTVALTVAPSTPAKSGNGSISNVTPQTPDLTSSNGASGIASPELPGTPNALPATVHTLASLARLPATEIIKLASSPNATGLPLPMADPLVFKSTEEFIDGLAGQSEQQKKQVVGTKLFKVVKAFGVRNAKITIHLLDTEDLRALTHLMNSYPSVLKEKVLQATAAASK